MDIFLEKCCHGRYQELIQDEVELIRSSGFDESIIYDFMWFYSDGLLCREKTYLLLKDFLLNCGSWNTILYESERLYYFSTTVLLDVLDEDKTDFSIAKGFV